jgi:hypothetical protein
MAITAVSGSLPGLIPFSHGHAHAPGDFRAQHANTRETDASHESDALEEKVATDKTNPTSRQTLSKEEQQAVKELAARDREVKAHEAAHKAAGGSLTGPASYSYTTGPDGKRYATGGEVSVDTSGVPGDPQATLAKANRIRAAALAPAKPSGQDRKVAAQAAQMAADARAEIAKQKREGDEGERGANSTPQLSSQPLYDHSGSMSSGGSAGNVLDEMV